MSSLFVAFFTLLVSTFRTRAALQAEILALRHQLAVFQKNAPRRLRLHRCDRLLWVVLYRFWSGWRRCLQMVKPDTVLRWHRRAFAWHWTGKSRRLPGRPEVAANTRELIQRMSQANPLWGAPRIHGELMKLGIAVAQSTVAIFASVPQTAVPDLANLPDESSGADGSHRFFHRANGDLPGPVRLRRASVRAAQGAALRGDGTSHTGVDHAADAGSVPLGRDAAICAARSRCHLRKRLRRHDPGYGNGGSAYCTTIPLAKSFCGTTGGLYPSRVPGPRYRLE